jgi:hypothetical protein
MTVSTCAKSVATVARSIVAASLSGRTSSAMVSRTDAPFGLCCAGISCGAPDRRLERAHFDPVNDQNPKHKCKVCDGAFHGCLCGNGENCLCNKCID